MLLVVDNGSVFTTNLSSFLKSNNHQFTILPFDKINLDDLENFDTFVLTGRRSNNRQMNLINSKIIQYCRNKSRKLLGICYGAELMVLTLGGTIRKMKKLQKGNEKIIITKKNHLFSNTMDVFESHRYELSSLGQHFTSIASSKSCKNEIIQHKKNKIYGTQFHPEMTNDGQILIENFLRL